MRLIDAISLIEANSGYYLQLPNGRCWRITRRSYYHLLTKLEG